MMKKSILEAVHDSVKGLYDIGLVDVQTLREFDALCLSPVDHSKNKCIRSVVHTDNPEPKKS